MMEDNTANDLRAVQGLCSGIRKYINDSAKKRAGGGQFQLDAEFQNGAYGGSEGVRTRSRGDEPGLGVDNLWEEREPSYMYGENGPRGTVDPPRAASQRPESVWGTAPGQRNEERTSDARNDLRASVGPPRLDRYTPCVSPTLEGGNEEPPRGNHRVRPTAKAPSFDGKNMSWEEFRVQFNAVATLNGWNDWEKAQFMFVNLGGQARKFAVDNRLYNQSYERLTFELEVQFRSQMETKFAQQRLRTRERKPDEPVEMFARDIERLVGECFKGCPREQAQKIALETVMNRLPEGELKTAKNSFKRPTVVRGGHIFYGLLGTPTPFQKWGVQTKRAPGEKCRRRHPAE